MSATIYSRDTRAKALSMLDDGQSIESVCAAIGCSKYALADWCLWDRVGDLSKRSYPPEIISSAMSELSKGTPLKDVPCAIEYVCKAFRRSLPHVETVRRWAKRRGVDIGAPERDTPDDKVLEMIKDGHPYGVIVESLSGHGVTDWTIRRVLKANGMRRCNKYTESERRRGAALCEEHGPVRAARILSDEIGKSVGDKSVREWEKKYANPRT